MLSINPLASPSAGAPALKYGDVNTVTPSPGEVKGLISVILSVIKSEIREYDFFCSSILIDFSPELISY